MVKATEGVYKYVEGGFAVKHKKDSFKASSIEVLIGYGENNSFCEIDIETNPAEAKPLRLVLFYMRRGDARAYRARRLSLVKGLEKNA